MWGSVSGIGGSVGDKLNRLGRVPDLRRDAHGSGKRYARESSVATEARDSGDIFAGVAGLDTRS